MTSGSKACNPLVSVGIPAYKSTYLSRAIDSVLRQTYRNLEIIIVNDCSPHDIEGIVGKYEDQRIRYYVNEKNVGAEDPGRNWNECLRRATGKYFCLLCDDDVYESTFVEEMLRLSEKYPQCNVFHSSVKVHNMNDEVIQIFPKSPEWESCSDYIKNVSRRRRKQTISEWMYKRTHVAALGGYDNLPLAWGSDYLSVMRFSIEGGIASTDKELAIFRRSNENITMKRQGQCETKIHSLQLYREKLIELVSGNKSLSEAVPLSCIERIKRSEDRAILVGASWKEFKTIFSKRSEYSVSLRTIIEAPIVKVIKTIIRK